VRLPLAVRPAAVTEAPPSEEAAAPFAQRVLVVDDNRDAADSLAMMLQLGGHEVQVAHDGPGALALAPRFMPDVVLLDIGMPGLNGYEVAERLRRDETLRDALLVAVTGWGQEEDKSRALAAGFDQHLTKPVDPPQLNAVLDAAAARRRQPH
jgi:CheY-like chemotaxis protein